MRLVSFGERDDVRIGVVEETEDGDVVLDVTQPLSEVGITRMEEVVDLDGPGPTTIAESVANDRHALSSAPIGQTRLLPPLLSPWQMLFVRANYPAPDGSLPDMTRPAIFSKVPSALIGQGETVILPEMSNQVDWEAELALVVGRRASHVEPEHAFDYISAYTINNDITARDIQASGEPALAKNFRTFSPLGPWLVTAEDVPDPENLGVRLWVNETLYQDGNTRDMLFGIPAIIAFLSSVTDLRPGDVIATGSPAGVGKQQDPPVFLSHGDSVRIEVDSIGTLVNDVVDQRGH